MRPQGQRVATDEHDLRRPREDVQLPDQRDTLRDDCGYGRSFDAEVEAIDEERVKDGVEEHRQYGCRHGRAGMTGRAQDGIEAEIEVGEDVAIENPLHVLTSIRQRLVGSSEEAQDGVESSQNNAHEEHAHDDVQRQRVAEELLGLLAVLLAKTHADHRGGAYAYHGTEGCRKVHQREGDGEAGYGHCADALTDEDAVDHIVERRGRHGYDGRHGILHEQSANGLCPKFFCPIVLTHNLSFCGCKGKKRLGIRNEG